METEDFAERISKFFESPQLAFYRLDSISYFASESGFNDRTVRSHLKNIARISLRYLGEKHLRYWGEKQLEALKILERVYTEALEERSSSLSKHKTASHKVKTNFTDPVKELYLRFLKLYQLRDKSGAIVPLKTLENLAEDKLLGFCVATPQPSGTGLINSQRVGGAKTK